MFASIALFEFRYQLRQPLFWIAFALFFLLTFGAMASPYVQIGGGGNVLANSPFAIAQTLLVMGPFVLFALIAFVANVVTRDDETGFGAMVRSTQVGKAPYLYGRFFGAFVVALMTWLALPLGMMIGAAMPWLDQETLGPFRWDHYAYASLFLAGPTLFAMAAIFFAVATITRSMMSVYVAAVLFIVVNLTAAGLLARAEFREVASLVDAFGVSAFGNATRFWTVIERNGQMPPLEGLLLANRALWVGVGCAFLALTYFAFRFEGKSGQRAQKTRNLAELTGSAAAVIAPKVAPNPQAGFGQLWARTGFEAREVIRHPAFLVLLLIGVLNAIGATLFANEIFGTPVRAVSRVMVDSIRGAFSAFPLLIAIYYAGELVWRERDKRVHEIIGASPAPDWSLMIPKLVALMVVLSASMLTAIATAGIVQVIKQHPFVELGNYILWFLVPQTVDVFFVATLSVMFQVLAPNKFAGYAIMIVYLVFGLVASQLGLDHNLIVFGGSSGEPLSDMNGAGAFQGWAYVFRAYWAGWALVLLTLAFLLWRRGADARLAPRLARVPARLRGAPGAFVAAGLLIAGGLGGYIYYNTNVLNNYRNIQARERELAAYEKRFLAYETLPQPTIIDVNLDVEIYPRRHWADVKGAYVLENRTEAPISDVHVRFGNPDIKVSNLTLEGGRVREDFPEHRYTIFALDKPMAPGARLRLDFATGAGQRGFRNSGNSTNVVDNGTFLNNFAVAPLIGMDRGGMLQSRDVRRRNGLPAELRMPSLEDEAARAHHYLRKDSDFVTARLRVTTDADQLAIAPGKLIDEQVVNGRRIVVHEAEAPIHNFFSIQSARYEVAKDRWNDVDLSIYYHKPHDYNVGRMMQAMKDSLDYYSANFSPYQFDYARVLEFPAYASFAQAFAGTMPYSEALGFIADNRKAENIDYAYYVTAHEVAHQWWAHQVIGSDQQGGTMTSETLAQYSALMVMKKTYGEDQIRRFLRFELDAYLRARGGEALEELPLMRVENQAYIHYRKGSLVMYLLQDLIGEEKVNRALARFLTAHAFRGAPYPRASDLVALFREEAGPEHQDLITDLFEKITLYDLKATQAQVTERADGLVDVAFTVEAQKLYADGKGVETMAPLAEAIEIGVFTEEPGEAAFDASKVLRIERRDIVSGEQVIRFEGVALPKSADGGRPTLHVGIDPYTKRIDRNSDDNFVRASVTPPQQS